jgi:EF hand
VAIETYDAFVSRQVDDDRKAREQVDRVFKKLDINQDGVITLEEFIESCLKVPLAFFITYCSFITFFSALKPKGLELFMGTKSFQIELI